MQDQLDQRFRIVGIDPGTVTLGVALLDFDLSTQRLNLTDTRTFNADQMLYRYPNLVEIHGERYARLMAHEENLFQYFQHTQPHALASEGPYLGRFPQAFAALTECVHVIRRSVIRYDPFKTLAVYDPATVKKNVSVNGKSGKKEEMRAAVLELPFLDDVQRTMLIQSDEHAIDAVAVAYLHFMTLSK